MAAAAGPMDCHRPGRRVSHHGAARGGDALGRSVVQRVHARCVAGCLARRQEEIPDRLSLGGPRADLAACRRGGDRRRGSILPFPHRLRFQIDPRSHPSQREAGQPAAAAHPRRQHHHAAGGQEPVPVVGTRLCAQRPRSLFHAADRNQLAQGAHSRGVSQHRAVRRRHLRRGSRRAAVLPQAGRAAESRGSGSAGRRAAQPHHLQGAGPVRLCIQAPRLDPGADARPRRA